MAIYKTGQEWADIVSDVYTVYGLRQIGDVRIRELSNYLTYHLVSTVILNWMLAFGLLRTFKTQVKPWKVLKQSVQGNCACAQGFLQLFALA